MSVPKQIKTFVEKNLPYPRMWGVNFELDANDTISMWGRNDLKPADTWCLEMFRKKEYENTEDWSKNDLMSIAVYGYPDDTFEIEDASYQVTGDNGKLKNLDAVYSYLKGTMP